MSTVTTFKSPALSNGRALLVLNRENKALTEVIIMAEVKRVTVTVNGQDVEFVNMAHAPSGFFTRVRVSALGEYGARYTDDGVALVKVSPVRTYSVSDFDKANGGAQ